jgi:hypothetical protein
LLSSAARVADRTPPPFARRAGRYYGAAMTDPIPATDLDPEPAPQAGPRRRLHPAIWALIGGVVALAIAGGVYALTRGTSTVDRQDQAISLCEKDLDGRLAAPATARYSGESVQVTGTAWTVIGDVEVHDAAGAVLRGSFNCILILRDDKFDIMIATAQ